MVSSKVAIFNAQTNSFSIENEKLDAIPEQSVLLKQIAIGINDIDVIDARDRNISNLGYTACGEIEQVGSDVVGFNKGDKVMYITMLGAYRQYRIAPQSSIVKIPDYIDPRTAVTTIYRACLAHTLTVRTFIIRQNINALIWGIHNPTSMMIALMAKQRGAFVVGVTSEKTDVSSEVCDIVIPDNADNISDAIVKATNGTGVHVFYNSIDAQPLENVVKAMVLSGVIVDHLNIMKNVAVPLIASKSLFFTAPSMAHYKSIRSELILTVNEAIAFIEQHNVQLTHVESNFDEINNVFPTITQGKNTAALVLVL